MRLKTIHSLRLVAFLLLVACTRALEPTAAADRDWKQLEGLLAIDCGSLVGLNSRVAATRWSVLTNEMVWYSGLQFTERNPGDQRWRTWFRATLRRPVLFYRDLGDKTIEEYATLSRSGASASDPWQYLNLDEHIARNTKLCQLVQEYLRDPGATVADCEFIPGLLNGITTMANTQAAEGRPVIDLGEVRATVLALAARFPHYVTEVGRLHPLNTHGDTGLVSTLVSSYEYAKKYQPEAVGEFLANARTSPNANVSESAGGLTAIDQAHAIEFKMAFTALDGRKVDLAELRGKIVVVDFWALWCSPCLKDLPNVREFHHRYRTQGVELIGVSADLEKDKARLLKHISEHDIDWPQHFDGKGVRNEYMVKFGVGSGMPALFVFDRKGKLIAANLHSIKEAEAVVLRYLPKVEPTRQNLAR